MRVGEAGERAVVARLRERFGREDPQDDSTPVPGTDDLVACTDVVLASSHFPGAMTLLQRGSYAAAVNLSDLAASGAEPLGLWFAFGVPADMDVEDLEEVAEGARTMAERFDCPVQGGDTKPADELLLAGFAVGRTEDRMPRSAARPGDAVCVTGELGGAGAGYEAWQAGRRQDEEALDRFLVPVPRLDAGRALAGAGAAACMDLSDGLAYSLHRLAEAAGVGFRVEEDKLPAFPGASREHVLFSGGDFELLATVPPEDLEAARDAVGRAEGNLTVIGEVVQEDVTLVRQGKERALADRGFEHFVEEG